MVHSATDHWEERWKLRMLMKFICFKRTSPLTEMYLLISEDTQNMWSTYPKYERCKKPDILRILSVGEILHGKQYTLKSIKYN
jgi:hypothetical protein